MNTVDKLAAALRAGLTPTGNIADMERIHAECVAALAEYDAQRAKPTTPAGSHTPGPWEAPSAGIYAGDVMVATVGSREVVRAMRKAGREHEILSNARRIVACVNACAGIPTEVLIQKRLHDALR